MVNLLRSVRQFYEKPALVYEASDVARILGLPCQCDAPPPKPRPGEVVFFYNGWNLQELQMSVAGKRHMYQGGKTSGESNSPSDPGYYHVQLRLPHSNCKIWEHQLAVMQQSNMYPAPLEVAVTAVLVHLAKTGTDLLEDQFTRCCAISIPHCRVVLSVSCGILECYKAWHANRMSDDLWAAAVRPG